MKKAEMVDAIIAKSMSDELTLLDNYGLKMSLGLEDEITEDERDAKEEKDDIYKEYDTDDDL